MRRALLLAGLVAAALAVGVAPAAATNECHGLQVCVPVAGPWVVLSTRTTALRPQQQFVLSCPKGYVVAGYDAELSDRAIDVGFVGFMGAPVNPGVSTSSDGLFTASYVGSGATLPSFRPHVGCMPSRGGGQRTPTAVVYPPGRIVARHARNVRLLTSRTVAAVSCGPGERLVDAWHAVAFAQIPPPAPMLADAVSVRQAVSGNRVVAVVTHGALPFDAHPLVQVTAVCVGGR